MPLISQFQSEWFQVYPLPSPRQTRPLSDLNPFCAPIHYLFNVSSQLGDDHGFSIGWLAGIGLRLIIFGTAAGKVWRSWLWLHALKRWYNHMIGICLWSYMAASSESFLKIRQKASMWDALLVNTMKVSQVCLFTPSLQQARPTWCHVSLSLYLPPFAFPSCYTMRQRTICDSERVWNHFLCDALNDSVFGACGQL
jgi:hypothetical protein